MPATSPAYATNPEPDPDAALWRDRVTARRQHAARPGVDRAVGHGQRLVSACLTLIAERGDTGFTMQDAAKAAGVSLSTAYARFRGKDELLIAALEDSARKTVEHLRERRESATTPHERLRTTLVGALSWAAEADTPPELSVLTVEAARLDGLFPQEMRAVSRILVDDLADELRRAAEAGIVDPIDIETDADVLVGLWNNRMMTLWRAGRLAEADQAIDYILKFAARALRMTEA